MASIYADCRRYVESGADGMANPPESAPFLRFRVREQRRVKAVTNARRRPAGRSWPAKRMQGAPDGEVSAGPRREQQSARASTDQDRPEVVDVGAGGAGNEEIAHGVEGAPGVVPGQKRRRIAS